MFPSGCWQSGKPPFSSNLQPQQVDGKSSPITLKEIFPLLRQTWPTASMERSGTPRESPISPIFRPTSLTWNSRILSGGPWLGWMRMRGRTSWSSFREIKSRGPPTSQSQASPNWKAAPPSSSGPLTTSPSSSRRPSTWWRVPSATSLRLLAALKTRSEEVDGILWWPLWFIHLIPLKKNTTSFNYWNKLKKFKINSFEGWRFLAFLERPFRTPVGK